jgi:hypothetical protein
MCASFDRTKRPRPASPPGGAFVFVAGRNSAFQSSSFRGVRSTSCDVQLHIRESIATIVSMDSGLAPSGAPRNDDGWMRAWRHCNDSNFQTASNHDSAFPRRNAPEVCIDLTLLKKQRAQGKPDARCTRGLACKMCIRMRTRAYRFSGEHPAFPAQWFYGLLRDLPGERAFLPPSPRRNDPAQLDASIGASEPHDFAVRLSHVRLRDISVHRIPPRVRDDRDPPLIWVRRAELCP